MRCGPLNRENACEPGGDRRYTERLVLAEAYSNYEITHFKIGEMGGLLLDERHQFATPSNVRINHINKHTLALFKTYDWRGNIRELQNVVERDVMLSDSDTFSVDESWFKREPPELSTRSKGLPALADQEVEMITAALAEAHGRIGGRLGAAAKLKVPRQTLESKIRRLGINKYAHKAQSVK